ncbi:MAG: hypothetical protein QOF58_3347 [Pseudonocardiales bacterium]|jgi:hypothetical protein|nr:hypothetical protein [Pseudonocardiales bacterium]
MTASNKPALQNTDVTDGSEDSEVMDLLQEHVPLALLCDLSTPEGPHSAEILAEEGQPTDTWWKQ